MLTVKIVQRIDKVCKGSLQEKGVKTKRSYAKGKEFNGSTRHGRRNPRYTVNCWRDREMGLNMWGP